MAERIAYCVKCKGKKIIREAKRVTTKRGGPAIKGKCGDCGCGMFLFLSKKEAESE